MIGFKEFISEKFVNAIDGKPNALSLKLLYVDAVWDILQRSYKPIGGIKSSGFGSPEEMIKTIPFWKIAKSGGRVVAVMLYKDRNGRKMTAAGTDGSEQGKAAYVDIAKNEFKRSFGEKSKAALGSVMKTFSWHMIEPFLITPDEVKKISGDEIIAITKVKPNEWPDDAKITLSKYPELKPYGYLRGINGNMLFKVMVGTPGKTIKPY